MFSVTVRVRLDITGVVQGVGFRPAVARIAAEHGLTGWVYNDAGAVHCEFEGPRADVDAAVTALRDRPPPMARIEALTMVALAPCGGDAFRIVESRAADGARTLVPPDIAACASALTSMMKPSSFMRGARSGHGCIGSRPAAAPRTATTPRRARRRRPAHPA